MITAKEDQLCKAHEVFEQMCAFLRQAQQAGQRLDQVERQLFSQAMQMCLHLLGAFVEQHGAGDEGQTIEHQGRPLDRLPAPHEKRYLSIFGTLVIGRWVYGTREGQVIEWSPLDAALGLPAGENSYVLEDWLQRGCVQEAFGEAVENLRGWLGTSTSVRTAETMNRTLAEYAEGFRLSQEPPQAVPQTMLVASADGKGVVIRTPLAERLRAEREQLAQQAAESLAEAQRLGLASADERPSWLASAAELSTPPAARPPRGRPTDRPAGKTGKKQMSYVGAVYSIAPFVRTPEDVVDDVRRRERSADRPRPQDKQVWAQMTKLVAGQPLPAAPRVFLEMAIQFHLRDPHHHGVWVCLMDGQQSLWDLKNEWFPEAVSILDLFHVLKRLWAVAQTVHKEQSAEAGEFVTHHLRMLLEGKVSYVIRNFRALLDTRHLRGTKRQTIQQAITYYHNNRQHMRYDEYLAAGYPIASGVVEGACRHLVKDRLERTGMRWELEGAQAMLSVRAIYLNDLWDEFIAYRIHQEQQNLYGKDRQPALAA
jgi:hypothetical protein